MQGQAKVTAAAEVRPRSLQDAGPERKARAARAWARPRGEPSAPPRAPTLGTRRRGGWEEWAPGPVPGGTEVSRQRRPGRVPGGRGRSPPSGPRPEPPRRDLQGWGAARRTGPGQRSPEASAAGAARAALRTAAPGPARRAAPRPVGPAPPRAAKPPPPPPSWPLQRGRRSRRPLRRHGSSKLARARGGARVGAPRCPATPGVRAWEPAVGPVASPCGRGHGQTRVSGPSGQAPPMPGDPAWNPRRLLGPGALLPCESRRGQWAALPRLRAGSPLAAAQDARGKCWCQRGRWRS